ncbi:hypothetical protein [Nonomuraea jabiensis]|uniref:hypothetical protein n=1 Tax=Nonomuraea jabiensis TaxID=882448 RepID=UPI003D74C509
MIPIAGPTVLPGRPPYSVEDLLTFPDDGSRYELFNGSLLISPLPTIPHQRAIFCAMRVLDREVPRDLTPLMHLGRSISSGKVVSPDTQGRDRALKVLAYAEAGIAAY